MFGAVRVRADCTLPPQPSCGLPLLDRVIRPDDRVLTRMESFSVEADDGLLTAIRVSQRKGEMIA